MTDGQWTDEGAELTNAPDPAAAALTADVIRVGRITDKQARESTGRRDVDQKRLREVRDREIWLAEVRERLLAAVAAANAGENAAYVWPSPDDILRKALDAAAAEIGPYYYDYA